MNGDNAFYSELKYDSSMPIAFIGLARLDRLDFIPRLTSRLRIRPSHINDTSCRLDQHYGFEQLVGGLTAVVDARAFTTPWTSSSGGGAG